MSSPIHDDPEADDAEDNSKDDNHEIEEEYFPPASKPKERHAISNMKFMDLIRDLKLSTRQTEMLGSRLKQWNLVEKDFKITLNRENNNRSTLEEIFKVDEENEKNFASYVSNEWRLFIDGSTTILKAVLLHNENKVPSVPLAYATDMKETYEILEKILRLIKYPQHEWQIVSDLKVLTILFGMQGGYTKHPCYLCELDSRAPNRYAKSEWPSRQYFKIGQKNVLNPPLVRPENVILPPLHLKLGYIKQFLKKLKWDGVAICYLKEVVFPKLSDAKLKGGILNGPQI
ncbi:uncharacterized protein LOC127277918 [Leptopilina boulardi]|uniref:uncharacterized protein LOC127277918 n=1 Tax=Leptopilina boulardi TaxID=63433 RepID=UPI0021F5324D|nr:uncharacterized protein LOC127277918 [Leptopilina boulardi]